MMTCPREPRPGEPITATWMASLVRYVKAITPLPGPNTKIARGPNGSVITGTPGGVKRSSGIKDLLPWHIVSDTRYKTEEGRTVTEHIHICSDCYYMAGQIMRKYSPKKNLEAIEDFVCQGEITGSEEYTEQDKPFLCFKYNTGNADSSASSEQLFGYKTYEEMRAEMNNRIVTVIPLFILTHAGAIKLDLRAIPSSQEFEIV